MSVGRFIKQFLPRGLFGRSFIIIVAPMFLVMGVFTFFFFEHDLDTTTRLLARDVAADVALLASLEDSTPTLERDGLRALAARRLDYRLIFHDGARVTPAAAPTSTIDKALDEIIETRIGQGRHFVTGRIGVDFDIKVDVKDGVLEIVVPRDRVTVSQPDIFILWMMGSALILLGIAILFLRNQVRPIERLARAADAFGKGRSVPDFKPYGASEVRRAAQAFLTMRERIERHVGQRTEMLAGVSHDLKTPLTRMKLALAMMDANPADIAAFEDDISEMEHMLDDYLAFARGEGGEEAETIDLVELVRDAVAAASRARQAGDVPVTAPEVMPFNGKRAALRRVLANLADNALKHGSHVAVTLSRDERAVEIVVEDDGPGIPENRYEEAFRPFTRLDEGRNLQTGGSGLGLAIARDIARAHGGDIALGRSSMGGLKATVRLPV
jgi:two-component system osmolarity sensor histidine kinase EnvZ